MGKQKKFRTDPGTVIISETWTQLGEQFGIEHKTCPKKDHSEIAKKERLIRKVNERLRANKQLALTKDKSGLSEYLYTLRVSEKKDGRSPFE